MRCIAFLDLLSGLYAGKLKWHGLAELKRYANKFMNPNYDALRLEIVYEGFRHKIAHLGHPYVVFDTPARRVAWTVNASRHSPAIRLNALPSTTLKKTRTPWPVQYDHRIRISLRSFSSDIVQSIYGPSGYLKHLQSEPTARKRFEKCMNDFYPP
jgi:hypothetical protein